MPSLFEMLKNLTPPLAKPEAPGAALLEVEDPAPPPPVGAELLERLDAVGAKGVNPPPAEPTEEETQLLAEMRAETMLPPVAETVVEAAPQVVAPVAAPVVEAAEAAPVAMLSPVMTIHAGPGGVPVSTLVMTSTGVLVAEKVPPVAETTPQAAAPVAEKVAEKVVENGLGGTCGTCGKTFQHIRRHKCKVEGATVIINPVPASPLPLTPFVAGVTRLTMAPEPKAVTFSVGAAPQRSYILLVDALVERSGSQLSVRHLADLLVEEALSPSTLGPWLRANPPRGIVAADTRFPETLACLPVLRLHASDVIRGVR